NTENHFMLSSQDFLLNASNEKAHIFIVVNRFDAICHKDYCECMILDQIHYLSPLTYAEREDLVHFVSAHEHMAADSEPFARMESALRSFTLEQCFKSKLAPAQRYAMNVLADTQYLAAENVAAATHRIQEINSVLHDGMPHYEALLNRRSETGCCAEAVLDLSCLEICRHTTAHLTNTAFHLQDVAEKITYPGLLSLWSYAENVLLTMVHHLEHEVSECDRFTSFTIHQAHTQLNALDEQHRSLDSPVSSEEATPVEPWDATMDSSSGMLTSISASASLSLLASNSMASNMLMLLRLSSTMGASTARRLMVTTAVLIGMGSLFYMVSDMDTTVRRKLSVRVTLMLEEEGFVAHHAERLTTETSRAIRPFVWHLQHNFQRMVEAEEHKHADHLCHRRTAQDSQIYFDELRIKAQDLVNAVRLVSSDS
ncbi:hypothetical protein COEREDRAFT_19393, partial [Coemansia reversa NRRL 1564]